MPRSLPVVIDGTVVGVKPGGEFTDNESGEVRQYGPRLQLLWETPDGEVDLLDVRSADVDKVAQFDHAELKSGDRVHIEGIARSGDRGLYLVPLVIERAGKDASLKAA